MLIAREATELLEEQERLLDLPMSGADIMLYEMRSLQIGELLQQLSVLKDSACISLVEGAEYFPKQLPF
jgi:hypothetical protein